LALVDELEEKREVAGSKSFETVNFIIPTLFQSSASNVCGPLCLSQNAFWWRSRISRNKNSFENKF
jgi:hypothetical protein